MSNYNSIQEFNVALMNVRDNLPVMMQPALKVASNNLADRIRQRVSSGGVTFKGGSFSPYSERYKKVKQKRGNSPYGKITNKKNFFLTGDMWSSFQVVNIQNISSTVTARLDFVGNNAFKSNRELNWIHSQDEFGDENSGGIAYPTQEEERQLVDDVEFALYEVLKKML